jgi:hypothetical protein
MVTQVGTTKKPFLNFEQLEWVQRTITTRSYEKIWRGPKFTRLPQIAGIQLVECSDDMQSDLAIKEVS